MRIWICAWNNYVSYTLVCVLFIVCSMYVSSCSTPSFSSPTNSSPANSAIPCRVSLKSVHWEEIALCGIHVIVKGRTTYGQTDGQTDGPQTRKHKPLAVCCWRLGLNMFHKILQCRKWTSWHWSPCEQIRCQRLLFVAVSWHRAEMAFKETAVGNIWCFVASEPL